MISRIPIAAQKKGEAFRPLPAYTENGRLVLEDGILGFVFLHQLEQHRAEQQDGDQVRLRLHLLLKPIRLVDMERQILWQQRNRMYFRLPTL